MRRAAIALVLCVSVAVPASAAAAPRHHSRQLSAKKVQRIAKRSRLQVRHVRAQVRAAGDLASAQQALESLAQTYTTQLSELQALTLQLSSSGPRVQALLDRFLPLLTQRLTALLPLFDQLHAQVPAIAGLADQVLATLATGSLPTLESLGAVDAGVVLQQAIATATGVLETVLGSLQGLLPAGTVPASATDPLGMLAGLPTAILGMLQGMLGGVVAAT